jgi:hypothetical protein
MANRCKCGEHPSTCCICGNCIQPKDEVAIVPLVTHKGRMIAYMHKWCYTEQMKQKEPTIWHPEYFE